MPLIFDLIFRKVLIPKNSIILNGFYSICNLENHLRYLGEFLLLITKLDLEFLLDYQNNLENRLQ